MLINTYRRMDMMAQDAFNGVWHPYDQHLDAANSGYIPRSRCFCLGDGLVREEPNPVAAQEHLGWERWRAIHDRVIRHPDYRYGKPHVQTLLKLAKFAQIQMAHYNTRYWELKGEEERATNHAYDRYANGGV